MILPNLNRTKVEIFKTIKKGSILLAALILAFILIKILTTIKNSIFPDPSLLPQASFGKLPAIPFPNNSENKNLSYSLDTVTGLLPDFQKIVKVYRIIPTKPDLLALKRTEERVTKIGFTKEGISISEDSYQWVEQNPPQTITINIFSSYFTFLTPYLTTKDMQAFANSSELETAIDEAKLFLKDLSLFPKDIDEEKTKTTYYSISDNALSSATSISNTNIVKVDFFQKNIDNLPIFYNSYFTSTINLLVGKENNRLKIVEGHYSYKNISDESSTYGIKTASEAFLELKEGRTHIAIKPNTNNVSIKNVSLGYYLGEEAESFLMPVIVFQGDNFIAYVLAIRDEWLSN